MLEMITGYGVGVDVNENSNYNDMSDLITGIIGVALVVYLLFVMVRPDKF